MNNFPIKVSARIASVVFHPVFLPTLIIAYLILHAPSLFFGIPEKQQIMWLITVAYTTITFPLLTVFLLWRLGFIESMHMRNLKERYGPLIASMLFYFWVFWLFHKQFAAPVLIQTLLLGTFLTTVLTFLVTIFFKISLHTAACSCMLAFSLLMLFSGTEGSLLFMIISILVSGIVASSRLYLQEHTPRQVYAGFVMGFIAIPLSYAVVKLIS